MAGVHEPNPVDLVMFATDRAMKRVGMPGAELHAHVHLRGRLDVPGFLQALAAVQRLHPAITGRLRWSALTGLPWWRLPDNPPAALCAVDIHQLTPATPEQLHRETERLLSSRTDPVNSPPLRFRLFRGLSSGDVLCLQWTHTLMDGRGGFLIVEEIEHEYQQQTQSLHPAETENTRHINRNSECPPVRSEARCESEPQDRRPASRRLCYTVRRFTGDDYRRIREAARRVCPSGRLDTFIRSAALLALGQLTPRGRAPIVDHAVQFIQEGREPPYRAPVCHNMFLAPLGHVPASLTSDRRALAARIDAQAEALTSPGDVARSEANVRTMSRLPMGLFAEVLRRRMISGDTLGLSRGLARLPSVPLGIMRAFTRRMPAFCGAEVASVEALRQPRVQVGWALQTVLRERQFSIAAVYLESKADWVVRFVDNLAVVMLDDKW